MRPRLPPSQPGATIFSPTTSCFAGVPCSAVGGAYGVCVSVFAGADSDQHSEGATRRHAPLSFAIALDAICVV